MLRASTLRKNRIRQSLFAQVIDIDRSCSGAVASTHNDKVTKRWRKIDHEHSDIGRGRTACAACTFSVVHNTQYLPNSHNTQPLHGDVSRNRSRMWSARCQSGFCRSTVNKSVSCFVLSSLSMRLYTNNGTTTSVDEGTPHMVLWLRILAGGRIEEVTFGRLCQRRRQGSTR